MTEPNRQPECNNGCIGHVQLGLLGKEKESQLLVTHARLTLPRGVNWIPAATYLDSADLLTVRKVSERTFLTLEKRENRPHAAHVVLHQPAHPHDKTYNQLIRSMVINPETEDNILVDMSVRWEACDDGSPWFMISPKMCFDQGRDALLEFMKRLVAQQDRSDKFPDTAIMRHYFMLGEPRQWPRE